MKKTKTLGKMLLTFLVSVVIGLTISWSIVAPCWETCPKDYPDDRDKCHKCCDNRCPNYFAKDKCYTNCPP